VLWTAVLVVVLVAAASGVAVVALSRTGSGASPAAPAPTRSAPTTSGNPATEPSRPSPSRRPNGPTLPEATATACTEVTEEVRLRVLTLNTHGAQAYGGFDLDRLTTFIRAADVDVALLQEVDRFRGRSHYTDMPRVLAARSGMELAYGLNVHLPGRAVSGTATLSRFPILSRRNVMLPTAPGSKPRGLLRTDLDVDGLRVSVFNTHLEHLAPGLRLRQAAALRGPVRATPHPVVLGGDLNSLPTSPTGAVMRKLLRDSWREAGLGPGPTAPAGRPGRRIDYLFHSPTLRVGAIDVMEPVVSDHRAVRARYRLPVAGDEVCVPELDGRAGGRAAGRDGGDGGGGRAR
jgi:endonuclease/exonuclease/phosphatase family metal-dependent hydrolase